MEKLNKQQTALQMMWEMYLQKNDAQNAENVKKEQRNCKNEIQSLEVLKEQALSLLARYGVLLGPLELPPHREITLLWDWNSSNDSQLSAPKGKNIKLIDSTDPEWWLGEFGGKQGYFPSSYAYPVVYEARIIQDHTAGSALELTVTAGSILEVIAVDDEWCSAEDPSTKKNGYIPRAYVEILSQQEPENISSSEYSLKSSTGSLQRSDGAQETPKTETTPELPKQETQSSTTTQGTQPVVQEKPMEQSAQNTHQESTQQISETKQTQPQEPPKQEVQSTATVQETKPTTQEAPQITQEPPKHEASPEKDNQESKPHPDHEEPKPQQTTQTTTTPQQVKPEASHQPEQQQQSTVTHSTPTHAETHQQESKQPEPQEPVKQPESKPKEAEQPETKPQEPAKQPEPEPVKQPESKPQEVKHPEPKQPEEPVKQPEQQSTTTQPTPTAAPVMTQQQESQSSTITQETKPATAETKPSGSFLDSKPVPPPRASNLINAQYKDSVTARFSMSTHRIQALLEEKTDVSLDFVQQSSQELKQQAQQEVDRLLNEAKDQIKQTSSHS